MGILVLTGGLVPTIGKAKSLIAIPAPFSVVVIFGVLVFRSEQIKRMKKSDFVLACNDRWIKYLGGSAIVLVQMIRALVATGFSAGVVLTLIFALIPFMSGTWALRIAVYRHHTL